MRVLRCALLSAGFLPANRQIAFQWSNHLQACASEGQILLRVAKQNLKHVTETCEVSVAGKLMKFAAIAGHYGAAALLHHNV